MESINALYKVTTAFASNDSIHDAVQVATDVATELTRAAFGAFFYNSINEKGEEYLLYTISGVDRSLFSRFPMPRNTALFSPTFNHGEVVRLDDVAKDPRYGGNAPHHGMPAGHLPVRSYLAVPVKSPDGELLGSLLFGHPDPGVFGPGAEKAALSIAAQAGSAIDRARMSTRISQSEKRFRQLANSIPQLAWMTDGTGAIHWYNDRWFEYTGTTIDSMRGWGWQSVHHPDHIDRVVEHFKSCIAAGEAWEDTFPLRGADGAYRWFLSRAFPLHDDGGKVTAWFGTNTDITEQYLAEQQQRFMADLALATQTLGDAGDIIAVTTRKTLAHMKCGRCVYANIDTATNRMIVAGEAVAGMEPFAGNSDLGAYGTERRSSLHAGKTFVSHDVGADARIEEAAKEVYEQAGARALISVPLHKDGRLVSVMAVHSATPRRWEDHEIALVEMVAARSWESLERARVTHDLHRSERHFRNMADSISQMIWVTRPDGYHEYYNKRWYEYTGMREGSTDGEEWNGMFHPDDQERAWKRWRHSLETGEPYEIEYRLRRADGVYRWALGRAECARDEAGRISKWYGTCTDIQELVDARERAEAANVAKTEFLANMSHEIRTPMNVVIGLSNILARSEPLSDRQKEYIRTLQISADGLLALINDLLDIAKIEARSVELEDIEFNLPALLQELVSVANVRAQEKKLALVLDMSGVGKTAYNGDPTRLRQILMNVVGNAIKFTEQGHVRIIASGKPCPGDSDCDQIDILVEDTGIGIPPEKIDKIFTKFVQADSSINRRYGGTGLGLAITRMLVELMGGRIDVESAVGRGTQFHIRLTLKRAAALAAPGPDGAALPAAGAARRARILLVEDYEPNIIVAGTFLEEFGYDYDVAANGLEAIEKFKTGGFGLIIMDVQMPGLNGLEATRIIRAHEEQNAQPPLPIIGMTAHATAGDRERCLGAGMDEYISKPFDPGALREKIASLLRARRTRFS